MSKKTDDRLAELKGTALKDVLRAFADLLDGEGWGRFQRNKPDGWVAMIGKEELPHRPLVARSIWYATHRSKDGPAERTTDHFEGNGIEYKSVLEGFGLTIKELD